MNNFSNEYFSLSVLPDYKTTNIKMHVFGDVLSTHRLPATHSLLKLHLPSILRSKCFNENNYSFSKEVRKTEIGHLFEHILLEYLCILKVASGLEHTVHNGLTSWNWEEESRGMFHINIDIGQDETEFLYHSLTKTIDLTVKILSSGDQSLYAQNVFLAKPQEKFLSLITEGS